MIETPPACLREIEEALGQLGLRPRRLVLISPLRQHKGKRCAYRVEAEDGRIVKVRQLQTPDEARRLLELRAGLDEAFAPVLARYGAVLLEAWIEGVPLTAVDAEERAEEGGALLGRLHGTALAPDAPSTLSTREWTDGAMSNLHILTDAGKLASGLAASLRAEILERDPGVARAALIHQDFCAENMLLDDGGRLRVIDNEQLTIAPAGFDLGRTFDRWPMSEGAWARFCRGYRSSAPAEIDAIRFWKIVAALKGARVRYQHSPARFAAALASLRRFAEGRSRSDLP
jgi:Ser/Thr protein kinase RdoA (MazF antagonist)